MAHQIRVLHVDDSPDLTEIVATFLEREDERITVTTAPNATAGLTHLEEHDVDCVVSDHDMPGPNGIEFLETVREQEPELPFLLYTGKGSETVASDAISAGVTDYLQKSGGVEQYEILANRIVKASEKRRVEREAEQTRANLEAVTSHSRDAIVTIDSDSTIRFANPAVERLFGYTPTELEGESLTTLMPDEYADRHCDALERYRSTGEPTMDWSAVEFPGLHRDGREISLSISFGAFEEDGERRFVGILRDERERERHRAFVEHSSDIVTALDANGTFQYVSPSAERILGYAPEELIGEDAFTYVHPDDREAVVSAFADSIDDESMTVATEYRLRRADGEYCWVESIGNNRLDDYAVGGYVINTRDISARKRREEKLAQLCEWTQQLNYTRTLEETTRLAVDAGDELMCAQLSGVHLVTDAGDVLEPIALADAVPEFFDECPSYERDAPAGSRSALAWKAFQGDESIAISELSTSDQLSEETPAESVILNPIGDHGLFIVSASTANALTDTDVLIAEILANHLKTALDRVDRESRLEGLHDATRSLVRAESQAEIAKRAVDAAVEVLGFSVVVVREHDEEAGGLVPLAVSESIEKHFPDRPVLTPDSGSLTWSAFDAGETRVYDDIQTHDTLNIDTQISSLMLLPVGEYGTIAIGETQPGVFDGTDEFLTRILATAAETAFQSATRTRRLHERSAELERQNDRLEEFASVVSHDLRNPLNVAQGRVRLASDECDSEHLDAATRAQNRMEALITDLLTLAREGQRVRKTTPVSLSTVAETCWLNVDTASATLTIEDDLTLSADKSRLQQLLENLIRNSVEHGSTGSRAKPGDSVEHGSTDSRTQPDDAAEHAEEDVHVTIGSLDDGSGFYVADDGPGIPADHRDKIFNAGFSTARTGTGFGLRIVEQVANAHGWEISVTNRGADDETTGARFELTDVDVGSEE